MYITKTLFEQRENIMHSASGVYAGIYEDMKYLAECHRTHITDEYKRQKPQRPKRVVHLRVCRNACRRPHLSDHQLVPSRYLARRGMGV